jgi:hypothetical protein
MKSISEIIKCQAEFTSNSGFSVSAATLMEEVLISHESEDKQLSVFLQNHEADNFIKKAKNLYDYCGDISMDEAYLAEAKPYIECL